MKAAAHLMVARKPKERKKKTEPYNSFREYPQSSNSLPPASSAPK